MNEKKPSSLTSELSEAVHRAVERQREGIQLNAVPTDVEQAAEYLKECLGNPIEDLFVGSTFAGMNMLRVCGHGATRMIRQIFGCLLASHPRGSAEHKALTGIFHGIVEIASRESDMVREKLNGANSPQLDLLSLPTRGGSETLN